MPVVGCTIVIMAVAMLVRMIAMDVRVPSHAAILVAPIARDHEASTGEDAVIVSDEFAGNLRQGGPDARQHTRFLVRKRIEEGGGEHVAGDAAEGVEMYLHARSCSLVRHRRKRTQHRSESSGGKNRGLETEGRSETAQSARI